MKAIVYDRYGPPEVARLAEIPAPEIGENDILVKVAASSVSTADWRMRASAFPGGLWLPGRLMTGLFRPKNRVLGTDFAGEVARVGPAVTGFEVGDRVFGFAGRGGHAEYVAVPANGAVARTPDSVTNAEAAALPFGALAALVFLRDYGHVAAGRRVLVIGASGGVGSYAVQIGKALGAEVTGVASAGNAAFVQSLGADRFIDYRTVDFAATGARWDVILDTVRPADFDHARRALTPGGVFLPLNFGIADMIRAPFTGRSGGPRMVTGINGDTRADLEMIAALVSEGALRPVIDSRFPMRKVRDAYARVEERHRAGAVILEIVPEPGVAAVGAAGSRQRSNVV